MFPEIPYPYSTILEIAITVIVAFILERLVTRYLKRFSDRRELPPEVGNGLVLIVRFLIVVGAVITLFRVGGLSTEWFTAISALGGAAIGFASTNSLDANKIKETVRWAEEIAQYQRENDDFVSFPKTGLNDYRDIETPFEKAARFSNIDRANAVAQIVNLKISFPDQMNWLSTCSLTPPSPVK